MKVVFKHKNEEFFKEVCKLLPSFAKRFQKACEEQWNDGFDFICIDRNDSGLIKNFNWSFSIPKQDIERVEDLDPFVWYPASKWNGNPQSHTLVERTADGELYTFKGLVHALAHETKFFMFVPKDKDIKPKC